MVPREKSPVGLMFLGLCLLALPLAAQEPSIEQLQSVVSSQVGGRDAPVWASDGSKIIFLSEQDGGLWYVSPDGGSPSKLVSGVPGGVNPRTNVQLKASPDGRYIAYVKGADGGADIFLFNLADKTNRRLTAQGARISAYSFSPDGRSIAFSSNRYGSTDIWTVSVPEGHTRRLTSDRREEVFPTWTPDGKQVIYTRLDEDWVDHDVFAIPAAGGAPKLIVADKNYFDYRQGAGFGFVRVSPDGKNALFRSARSGWANYWVAPMAGGVPRPIAPQAADQSDGRWSPDGKSILFLAMNNGTQSVNVVPSAGGPVKTLAKPEQGIASRADWSPDGKTVSYTMGSPVSSEDLYVVGAAGGSARRLTTSSPTGEIAAALVTPEKVSWVNDGYTINAYLFKPKNLPAGQRVPVIVLVHGGPTGQFSDNYQLQQQFFVNRGYAVLTPNVRGSSGYGISHNNQLLQSPHKHPAI